MLSYNDRIFDTAERSNAADTQLNGRQYAKDVIVLRLAESFVKTKEALKMCPDWDSWVLTRTFV